MSVDSTWAAMRPQTSEGRDSILRMLVQNLSLYLISQVKIVENQILVKVMST